MNFKLTFPFIFLFICNSLIAQEFNNKSPYAIFPNCEKDSDPIGCLQNNVGELIVSKAKERKLEFSKDTLKVTIKINKDGTQKILDNSTKNSQLKNLSSEVLKKLPIIEPAYSSRKKDYVSSSYSFYILIENNKMINKT